MTTPLQGIRVLDLTMLYPGPLCTMILADLGAEVIKVEPPGSGDHARAFRFLFNQINRNKKSLALNLKDAAAQEAFRALARTTDVVVEGFRPGTTARLGVDYDSLKADNPRLIYCSISGFGQDGPYRDRPGHDINYMALGGVLGLTRDGGGDPVIPGFEVADITSALNAVIAIQAALLARERTGEGQYVDISMLDCVVALLHNSLGPYLETGEEPPGNFIHMLPHYGIFETSDGKRLALGIVHEDWFWKSLCEAACMEDVKDLLTVERLLGAGDLLPRVAEAIRSRPLDEWVRVFDEHDVPCAPLASVKEALDDPQVRHRDMVVEIKSGDGAVKQLGSPHKLSATPPRFETPAPALGQHTDEVLAEAGYDAARISELREKGAAA